MGIDPGKETEPFAYWIFRCRGGSGGTPREGRGATNLSPQPPSSPSSGLQMIGRYRPFILHTIRLPGLQRIEVLVGVGLGGYS